MDMENGNNIELQQLHECQQEVERWKELYLRVNADIENMKRRAYKDQELIVNRSMMGILSDFLPIIDNFDRALASTSDMHNPLVQGLMLIRKEFAAALERHGVHEMTEVTQFDPEHHEAVSQVASDATHPVGSIITVLEKGYWYKDQVLRHAKVTVAI